MPWWGWTLSIVGGGGAVLWLLSRIPGCVGEAICSFFESLGDIVSDIDFGDFGDFGDSDGGD